MSDRDATLRALNDLHSFPGPFTFKVIGENSADFVARVVQAAVMVLGPTAYPDVKTRESAHGRHQSVTFDVRVESAESVLEVYAALSALPGVRYLL
jgi:putative lipoic acid-binding regulatory protein